MMFVPLVRYVVTDYAQQQFREIASYVNRDEHHSLLLSATNTTGRVARAMAQADHDSLSVSRRVVSVIASEDARSSNTDVEAQLEDGDALLKCFSPLFNSMRLFGLYFTQSSRRIHDASTSSVMTAVSKKWNGGRIYAVVIMVVNWLNVARIFTVFDKTDKFGFLLLLKLALVSAGFLIALLHTACFVACQTGNLDRVFLDARLPKSDISRYRRLAVIHTIGLWFLLMVGVLVFLIPLVTSEAYWSLSPIVVHVPVSDELILLAKVLMILLFVVADSAWFFSYSVNYIGCSKVLQSYSILSSKNEKSVN